MKREVGVAIGVVVVLVLRAVKAVGTLLVPVLVKAHEDDT